MNHGTLNGYNHYRCRCRRCKDAAVEYALEAKQRRLSRPMPRDKHGTNLGYVNWDCRCPECRRAHTKYERMRNGKTISLIAAENDALREERDQLLTQIKELEARIIPCDM